MLLLWYILICLTTIDIRNSTVYFNKVSMMTATMRAENIYLSRAEPCFCGDSCCETLLRQFWRGPKRLSYTEAVNRRTDNTIAKRKNKWKRQIRVITKLPKALFLWGLCWTIISFLCIFVYLCFFRNACTKSGSLRFSQFTACWLILSVYIIMSFDFPFVRLFGVR
jgi:hypothetical protein